jgi:isocitrate dehydrogenase kinase/phosphatase
LLPGYVRINIETQDALNSRSLINSFVSVEISEGQKMAIKSIFNLYSTDKELMKVVKDKFMQELEKRPNLSLLKEWFDNISTFFRITPIGEVLAYTNSKRCCSHLPPMREY